MRSFLERKSAIAVKLLLAIATLIFSVSVINAQVQSNAANLIGTVRDPNGAIVPNATVTARNPSINVTRTTTTVSDGDYQLIGLPPGEYEITVTATNFKKTVIPNVKLTVGQAAELDITLEIGQVGETVTVTGSSLEIVETSRTSVSTTIDQQRIDNLPINQRDYLGFTLTTSNVGRDNGRPIGPAPTTGINIGGQRGRSSLVQVDGADNTDNSVNAARTTVSQEAVQEFQVVTNGFNAEFGRSAGGVVNVVTKRGTNQFTGNAFFFLRDKRLQNDNFFAPIKNADFNRKQYGVTFGGPLAKDRTFFFFAYERRERDESGFFTSDVIGNLTSSASIPVIAPVTPTGTVNINPLARTFDRLTSQQAAYISSTINQGVTLLGSATTFNTGVQLICAARTYAFFASSGGNTGLTGSNPLITPNDGSVCPAISPILPSGTTPIGSRFLLSGAPLPISTIAFRPLTSLDRIFPVTDRTNFSSIRLDQVIDDNNQLNLRFGYNPINTTGIQVESQNQSLGQNDFSRTGIARYKDTNFSANLVSSYGNFLNELKFGFGRRKAVFRSQNNDAVAINVSGTAFFGRELFSPVDRTETRFQIADNLSWVYKDHNFKFGGDFNWVTIPSAVFELNFSGLFNFGPTTASTFGLPGNAPDFTPVQSYGLGFPSVYIQGFGNPVSRIKNQPLAWFAQDSWKILPNLTLNYGVRYDLEITDEKDPVAFFDPLSGINLSASDIRAAQDAVGVQQGFPTDKNNFAPRFGFAYDPFRNSENVIRGSIGLFYDHPLLAVAFNSDIADAVQQQQLVLTAGSPTPTNLLNAAQVFQGTVCIPGGGNPLCAAGVRTPGVALSAQYQFGRQRFNDQTFPGFGAVLPFTLPVSKDFKYANAVQANLAYERQLTRTTTFSISYQFVGVHNLPHPTDLNPQNVGLIIENFRRFAGRAPLNSTEALGFSIPTTGTACPGGVPLLCYTNSFTNTTYAIIIPGMITAPLTNLGSRVVAPAVANFFRTNAPNYFLAQALSGGAVTKAVLDSQLVGSLRTPGLISPFGTVNAQVSDGNSNYNGLTLDFKGRLSPEIQFLVSYTLSKSIDDSSDLQTLLAPQDVQNFRAERSLSLFDQRHRYVMSAVFTSPTGWRNADNGFKRFMADFTLAPIVEISSGRPFNIITNTDTNVDQSTQTDRPNVLPNGTLVLPAQFTSGNLGRNMGVTHSFSNVDVRLSRAIRFGDRVRLDLIGEAFNLFNRFNEGAASPFFLDVNAWGERSKSGRFFSRPTAAYDARQFQLGIKLNF